MDREAEHLVGRTQGGLCRGHGSGDRAAASAGPCNLSGLCNIQFTLDDEQLTALKDELLTRSRR